MKAALPDLEITKQWTEFSFNEQIRIPRSSEVAQLRRGEPNALSALLMRYQPFDSPQTQPQILHCLYPAYVFFATSGPNATELK
jgi:hypothetical protein